MTEKTRRQEILDLLRGGEQGFEYLRFFLELKSRDLEEELRHVEMSARRNGERMVVVPAECEGCGFVFRNRSPRRLQPPGRCPRCRSERIAEPRFRLEAV